MLLALAGAAIGALILVNQDVRSLDNRLHALNRQIDADYQALHVLRAEYTHLTRPQRLQALATEYLDLTPLQGEQMVRLTPNDAPTQEIMVMRDDQQPSTPTVSEHQANNMSARSPENRPNTGRPVDVAQRAPVTVAYLPATFGQTDRRRPIDTVVDLVADLFALADYGPR